MGKPWEQNTFSYSLVPRPLGQGSLGTRLTLNMHNSSRFIQTLCNEITVFCCWSFYDHMQAVKQHFGHFAKWDMSVKVVFQESEITLNVPEEGIIQDGWKITPMTYPVVCLYCMQVCVCKYWCHSSSCLQLYTLLQIAERDANKFKEGKWIPQCELMMKWKRDNEEPGRLEYRVFLNGAREHQNYLLLVLDPREGSPHDELHKWCTVSYW